MNNNKKETGQILIESLIAITIGVVALVSYLTYLSETIASNRIMNERSVATYIAIEGIEVIKGMLDANYVEGRSWNNNLGSGTANFEVQYNDTNSPSASLGSGAGTFSQRPLRFNSNNGLYSYISGSDTQYYRTVRLRWDESGAPGSSNDSVKVESIVQWEERRTGQNREVIIESFFFDWRWQ